jgi:REP element-mobilizing transposase RayT
VVTTVKHWLSEIIRWFKTFSSRNINNYQNKFIFSWQRSFYDVIIRNEKQLNIIRQYIIDNPLKWEFDKNNT